NRSLLAEVLVARVELLDAAGAVEDALLARVERVRGGGDLDVHDRVGLAVQLDGLLARQGRAREEGLAARQVTEDDRLVVGVDVGLHEVPQSEVMGKLAAEGPAVEFS